MELQKEAWVNKNINKQEERKIANAKRKASHQKSKAANFSGNPGNQAVNDNPQAVSQELDSIISITSICSPCSQS